MSEIIIIPYSWKESDEIIDDKNQVLIKCWALDKDSNPYLLKIVDYYSECFVQLPYYFQDRKVTWTEKNTKILIATMIENFHLNNIHSVEFIDDMSTIYHYTNNPFEKFLRFRFTTISQMTIFTNNLRNPDMKIDRYGSAIFKVLESNISVVRKLLTERNIGYASWFAFFGYQNKANKISTLEREFTVKYEDLHKTDENITNEYSASPGILAFDIETYSDNHRRMPEEINPLHTAYMISGIFQKYKKPETRKRYGIIIGECSEISEDRLKDCKIFHVNSEKELVDVFNDVVQECDPEIISGYNIFKYDYPYLDHRLQRLGDEWPNMSRLINSECKIESSIWVSSAYGAQDIFFLGMEGRISMDLYPIISREYNRLPKYDLNTVSMYFLNDKKHDIKAKDMFMIYEELMKSRKQYSEDKNFERRYLKAMDKMADVLAYCIQDSELVIDLCDKLNIWDSLIQMSNVVGVPILDLYTKGQQHRCLSVLYDAGHRAKYIINSIQNTLSSYKGGSVAEPLKGLHDNTVCLDFKSLYPSIIIAYNICYTTLIKNENILKLMKGGNYDDKDKSLDYIKFEFDDGVGSSADNEYEDDEYDEDGGDDENKIKKKQLIKAHFVTPKVKKGLLPTLVQKLINDRNSVRKEIGINSKILEKCKLYENTRENLNEFLTSKKNKFDIHICYSKFSADKNDKLLMNRLRIAFMINMNLKIEFNVSDEMYSDLLKIFNEIQIGEMGEEDALKGLRLLQLNYFSEENVKKNLNNIKKYQFLILSGDKRQNAIKVSTNSFYGFLGVQNNGKLPLLIGAACTTYVGRTVINDVNIFLMNHEIIKAIIVYGDTDSTMFKSEIIKTAAQCDYWGRKTAEMINGVKPGEKDIDGVFHEEGIPSKFRDPLQVEFEKAMRIFCIKKKKYAALYIKKNGDFKEEEYFDANGVKKTRLEILKRGIAIARRDNCQFFRNTYEKCLTMILLKKPIYEVLESLFSALNELISNKINYQDLVIIMGIKDQYKKDSHMLNIFKNYLNDIGISVSSGDRLDFVIVKESSRGMENDPLLGYKLRLKEQVDLGEPGEFELDYDYYIAKKLSNPLNQLVEIAYPDEIEMSKQVMNFRRTSRCKMQFMNEPISYYMSFYNQVKNHGFIVNYMKNTFDSLYELKENINEKRKREGLEKLVFSNQNDVSYFNEIIKMLL